MIPEWLKDVLILLFFLAGPISIILIAVLLGSNVLKDGVDAGGETNPQKGGRDG